MHHYFFTSYVSMFAGIAPVVVGLPARVDDFVLYFFSFFAFCVVNRKYEKRKLSLSPPPHTHTCRCINFLREKANCTPPDGSLSETEEAAVSRSLELVRFLLESFHPVCVFSSSWWSRALITGVVELGAVSST